ncbi:MAG: HAD hydrolase-like protein, partial [Thermoplasmata archaeon]|nr:HAD hydrolase-like protein [Thermoplasmata archaeon]
KPETGMFDQVNEKYDVDYTKSWFVGDFESDRQVAERVGLNFVLAKGNGGLKKAVEEILSK